MILTAFSHSKDSSIVEIEWLNFSSLIGEIFVKTQNLDSYDVIMT